MAMTQMLDKPSPVDQQTKYLILGTKVCLRLLGVPSLRICLEAPSPVYQQTEYLSLGSMDGLRLLGWLEVCWRALLEDLP